VRVRFDPARAATAPVASRDVERVGESAISEAECWDLVRTVTVGRLALSLGALPVIVPVQFRVEGSRLAICMDREGVPHLAIADTIVALEADSIDRDTRLGWSVLVQGFTHCEDETAELPACGRPGAGRIVYLTPGFVSGRRIRLCRFGADLPVGA
jgi:uncharacterized protein